MWVDFCEKPNGSKKSVLDISECFNNYYVSEIYSTP